MAKDRRVYRGLNRGFSLLEMLLSLAVLALIFAVSSSVYSRAVFTQELDSGARGAASLLGLASARAGASAGDAQWGVAFVGGSAVLFKGASYAARNEAYDETLALPGLSSAGQSEYVFAKMTGRPAIAGSTTLTFAATGESATVEVNDYATIFAQ